MRTNNSAVAVSRFLIATLPLLLVGCAVNRKPAEPGSPSLGRPLESGFASWYGPGFHGRRTANGEKYNMYDMTAAHPRLPFGTRLEVRNVKTGQTVTVRINDRGPFKNRRILDLSYAAARQVGVFAPGTAYVEIYPTGRVRPNKPEQGPAIERASVASRAPQRYTVQVGAFGDAGRAVDLHREISRIYPEVFVHSDGTWNRVQVGLFTDRDQAEALRRELAVLGMSSVVMATR